MISIFKDSKGAFAVQTTCLDTDAFLADLAEALSSVENHDGGIEYLGILTQAMPIAFKLAGYKADTVHESRTLLCGILSPHDSTLITSAGK